MAGEGAVKKALPSTPDCRPPGEVFCGEIIELHVGTNEAPGRIFRAHKDLLNFYSGYFQAATNGKFVEAEKGRVDLATDDIETVQDFVTWLYTRGMPGRSDKNANYHRLCKLWIWADLRDIPLLANMVIDAIRGEALRGVLLSLSALPNGQIRFIWENTAAGSKLRALVAMLYGTFGYVKSTSKEGAEHDWVADAMWEVLKVMWERQRKGITETPTKKELSEMNLCDYHVHEEGVKCPKKG